MKTACVLWGGYAGGNVGDELTLAIGLKDRADVYHQDQIAILSPNPAISASQFPDAHVIYYEKLPPKHVLNVLYKHVKRHRVPSELFLESLLGQVMRSYIRRQFDWVKTIREADELYLVGGGYLTDLFQLDSILLPALIAQHYGKKIITAPVGVGPFSNPVNREIFRKAFRDVTLTVRDTQSQQLCQSLGLEAKLTRDDGFRLKELAEFQNFDHELERSGKIGICIHHQHGANASADVYFSWWKTLLEELVALGLMDKLEGFCFHTAPGLDHRYLVEAFGEVGIPVNNVREPIGNFIEALKHLSRYNLVVTTRFHAAVAASAFEIPFFAMSSGPYYRNKMDSVVQGQKLGVFVDLQNSDPKVVAREVFSSFTKKSNDLQ